MAEYGGMWQEKAKEARAILGKLQENRRNSVVEFIKLS